MHWATGMGHAAVITPLLEAGANVHATDDNGWTPRDLAAAKGHATIVMRLWKAEQKPFAPAP